MGAAWTGSRFVRRDRPGGWVATAALASARRDSGFDRFGHPVARSARYFDLRFGLKERVSTALEIAGGAIEASPLLAERQLNDTTAIVSRVRPRAYLPLRVRWGELVIVVALAIVFAILLLTGTGAWDD